MNRESHLPIRSFPRCRGLNRFRVCSLEAAAAGLASSALANNASAAIISDLALSASPGTAFSVDGTVSGEIQLSSAVGMGGVDLSLESPVGMGMNPGSTVQLSVFSSGGMNPTDFLTLLNPGDTVDGSLGFASEGFLVDNPVINPVWAPGTTGYAGFVFQTGGSAPLYGWLQIEFDISGVDFTVLQWAYDDTGAPISVATPEPGTGILLALGLVGFSALFRKRRRANASAAA